MKIEKSQILANKTIHAMAVRKLASITKMNHQRIELTWNGPPADFSFELYPFLLTKFGGRLVCAELLSDDTEVTKLQLLRENFNRKWRIK